MQFVYIAIIFQFAKVLGDTVYYDCLLYISEYILT